MPVTTKTFRNMTVLNILFAISSVLLVLTTMVAVVADWYNEYRVYQVESKVWKAAFAGENLKEAEVANAEAHLGLLKEALAQANLKLSNDKAYQDILKGITDRLTERNQIKKSLQLFVSGNISPDIQRIEYLESLIQTNENNPSHMKELEAVRAELAELQSKQRIMSDEIAKFNRELQQLKAERQKMEVAVADIKAKIKPMQAAVDKARDQLDENAPDFIGQIGEKLRDAPLLTWMNPDIKVKQTLPPGIKTEYNLLTAITIDRCQSCHINIDNPQFAEADLLTFLQRKVADGSGQDVLHMSDVQPVVMLQFWESSIRQLSGTTTDGGPISVMKAARKKAMTVYNRLLAKKPADDIIVKMYSVAHGNGSDPSARAKVRNDQELQDLFEMVQNSERVGDWKDWYEPLTRYGRTLRETIETRSTKRELRAFNDVYRRLLVRVYNEKSAEYGRKKLSADRVMLAHPQLGLIAHPDSIHSVAKMGCTVCHGGSGEETQFEHTAHMPQDIWVDASTGMFIPDFLIAQEGSKSVIEDELDSLEASLVPAMRPNVNVNNKSSLNHGDAHPAVSQEAKIATASFAYSGNDQDNGHSLSEDGSEIDPLSDNGNPPHESSFNEEYWYSHPDEVRDTFGPGEVRAKKDAIYYDPVSEGPGHAIRQEERWEEAYNWEDIHFSIWERPMHELRFVESSCSRCHTQIMDIDREAPTLAEGRLLFAQFGCVDCHANDPLGSPNRGEKSAPDVRQIGPSLVHVNKKLSEEMIASWVFAPRAFRPSTKMPHIWLGENGSSPIDIRRSRTEVQAIAHYLMKPPADPKKPAYDPEAIPVGLQGNAKAGQVIFTSVGCMGCHANVNEHGLELVTEDVMKRFGLDKDEATSRMAKDGEWIDAHADEDTPDTNVGFFKLDGKGEPTAHIRPDQYTRLQWYLMAYEPDRFTRFGPELSGVATKLTAGRTEDQARSWLYDWVRNPTHYSDYTRMPSLRLTEQEAIDIAEYLLTQRHPTYRAAQFSPDEYMIDAILLDMQKNAISDAAAREKIASMTLEEKEMDLGQRMIQYEGCFGCHQVPGFTSVNSVSANLSKWGTRDPHRLDFGYFDSVYDDTRPPTAEVWTTYKGGAFEGAVNLTEHSIGERGLVKKVLPWEDVSHDRRGYIENKLFNPRIFDRSRASRDGAMTEDGRVLFTDVKTRSQQLVQKDGLFVDAKTGKDSGLHGKEIEILDIGEPYTKLRMPQFFLRKSEVEALVTYVTSLFPPLVDAELQNTTDELGTMRVNGKLMAISQNCFGCHNAENNEPTIGQYYEVRKSDGSINYTATQENMVNAPPRIVGNGAKTRHDWFYTFLGDIQMIRPWLTVRMPSFNLLDAEKNDLIGYLVGQTNADRHRIGTRLKKIDEKAWSAYTSSYSKAYEKAMSEGMMQVQADTLAKSAATKAVGEYLLKDNEAKTRTGVIDLVNEYTLYAASQTPNENMKHDELARALGRSYYDLRFLRNTYSELDYPFSNLPYGEMISDEEFARGQHIVEDLQCLKCHALGDWGKLERIFDIEQAELNALSGSDGGDNADEGDGYGDDYGDEGGDSGGQDEGYGDEGGYGGDEIASPKEQSKPTLYDNLTAPNFRIAMQRLQADYIRQWLRKPQAIMPGSKMPNMWGPDGTLSAFAAFPEEMRKEKEALYGKSAEEQMDLIVKFLTATLSRDYTYNEEKLQEPVADGKQADGSN